MSDPYTDLLGKLTARNTSTNYPFDIPTLSDVNSIGYKYLKSIVEEMTSPAVTDLTDHFDEIIAFGD